MSEMETLKTAEEFYSPECEGGCSPISCFSMSEPGLRLWLDRGVGAKTGTWMLRMPSGEEEPDTDEEGSVWLSQDVLRVIYRQLSLDTRPSA